MNLVISSVKHWMESSLSPSEISNVIFVQCMIEENILKSSYPRFEIKGAGFDFSEL